MSDDEIEMEACRLRWGSTEYQKCPDPDCGNTDRHYRIKSRRQWRCKSCGHTFSVTSSTKWAYHKLSLRELMIKICGELAISSIGRNASEIANRLNRECKTAWVNLQKVREAIFETADRTPLQGTIHTDAAYVCYHVRPKNRHSKRVDRRLRKNQNPHKRAILIWRQLATPEEIAKGIVGSTRTMFSVVTEENQADVLKLTMQNVVRGSVICSDQNDAYNLLRNIYDLRTVNHQKEYVTPDGISNNQAESAFARLRAMQKAVHHFWWKHAWLHAAYLAYLEDVRRTDTKTIFEDLVSRCLKSKPSRDFAGYWQGNKCFEERLCF